MIYFRVMFSAALTGPELGVTYLKAASWTVLCDDAHVWRVDTGANEAGQVFILDISHLQKHRGCYFKSYHALQTKWVDW